MWEKLEFRTGETVDWSKSSSREVLLSDNKVSTGEESLAQKEVGGLGNQK